MPNAAEAGRESWPMVLVPLEPRLLFSAALPHPPPLDLGGFASPAGAAIPGLSSKPDAPAKLYLDFDGAAGGRWGGYDVTDTPAYDRDGNPDSFSDAEITAIQEIWARVAEKFSPFNLNVTTVDPGTLADKVALRAVIGGDGKWSGGTNGGIAYVGSFYNSLPNTVYIFPENLGSGHPAYVGEAIAHESGHAFGLEHQSVYDSSGKQVDEYNRGGGGIAPIMGSSYNARGIWWNGTSTSATTFQDDLAILASSANGFGYRRDDHGDGLVSATPLTMVGNQGNGAGVIERITDEDYFSFVTGSGNVSLVASPAAFGAMLDLALELYTFDGTLVAVEDSALLGETIALYLQAGSYRLGVFSANNRTGDIGQYTISATLVAPAETLPAPTSLSAMRLEDGSLRLAWEDNAGGELGYRIQRSTDRGRTFLDYAETGADATEFIDAGAQDGKVYVYQVAAFDDSAVSPYAGPVMVILTPATPAGVTATALGSRRVRVTWEGVKGASGYVIERARGDNSTFKAIGLTSGGAESFEDTGLVPGITYRYRVRAMNAGGYSEASVESSATTVEESGIPAAPSSFSVARISSAEIRLSWQDNSDDEIGFKIQWSSGSGWETVGRVRADKTAVSLYLWRSDAAFRVAAYNREGRSSYTDSARLGKTARAQALLPDSAAVAKARFSQTRISIASLAALLERRPRVAG